MKKQVMVIAAMVAMSACTVDAQSDGMVLIKGGTFQMGNTTSEAERDADETRHEVTVQDFLMSATEVSQQEYESVMGNNPIERKGSNLPVENVILKGLDVTYSSYDRTAIRSWLDGISQYQQTSGISAVKQGNMSSDVYYSLNGQKVKEPHRGIYIVNGEKRIIE